MADAGARVLKGLLDVYVLASLERAPKHGYALLREMADAFGTEPNRNRLYPLLGRMVADGLLAERNESEGGRTLYQLTDAGRAALAQYRALPPTFHEHLARIWTPTTAPPPTPAPSPSPSPSPSSSAARAIPVLPPRPGAAPYPCEEARVTVERAPRSGEMRVTLTGCPMGAYDYCALCPVAKGVEGLRKLAFL